MVSAAWIDPPLTMPDETPVTAAPGHAPRSPSITVAPVLVTLAPASTANDVAVPSGTSIGPACALAAAKAAAPRPKIIRAFIVSTLHL
jgi:hypothetical protein